MSVENQNTREENIISDSMSAANQSGTSKDSQQTASYYYNDSKYEGDLVDTSATPLEKRYRKLDYQTPAELFCFFNEDVAKGKYNLYKWQTELLESFANVKADAMHPHKHCLVAANGSGKDSIIAASFSVWFALCKIQSRVIITSSSGTQLTSQTEPAIRGLCEKVNEFFGQEIFRIRQRYIVCRLSGSEIRLFATDEAGKAEGYHPIVFGGEMAILLNEAKSIKEDIYSALKRCTGFNYWIEYSSPGETSGFFYKDFCASRFVELSNLDTIRQSGKYACRVTSFDCPNHLSEAEREDDKRDLGEHSALYRSKHLALFTSLGGEVIIPTELLDKIISAPPQFTIKDWKIRVGIDLAAGGDENGICFTLGCKVLKEIAFRETDTMVTADRIEMALIDNRISKDHEHIYADDGGVGHAIIDVLVRRGWKINRIMNQWAAYNRKQFGNRGAENWYRVKRILEENLFDVTGLSDKTRNQLATRRYKQGSSGARIFLESKKEAKANGRPSPDRADAFILSLTGLTVDDFLNAKTVDDKPAGYTKGETLLSGNEQITTYYEDNVTYAALEGKPNLMNLRRMGSNKKIHGSLSAALGKDNKNPMLN